MSADVQPLNEIKKKTAKNSRKKPASRPDALALRLKRHLDVIYPECDADELIDDILSTFWPDDAKDKPLAQPKPLSLDTWSEATTILITYGDSIRKRGEHPLKTLEDFLEDYAKSFINAVHILPFFPYSSDDGFAVMDYDEVRGDLGGWDDVERIGNNFQLMADIVINHASAQGQWFKDFKENKAPYNEYFFTAPMDADTSLVIRPRPFPLLTPFDTADGMKHVWCTFGPDQVDLDFSNPAVLVEFIRIMRLYLNHKVRIFRLDAVAFLWKEIGTACIHLPQTHEIVRLMRTLVDFYKEDVLLITETNVPKHENLSYFGNQNEAHMIYNFSLPPLLVQALLTGNEYYLKKWLMGMPPTQDGCAYFNFVAGHDGIGLFPAKGILMDEDVEEMIETVRGFGGEISMRSVAGGKEQPYEMNVSLFDALQGTIDGKDELQRERFLASQTIMMGLAGIPAFYIHSLLATPNDYAKMKKTDHRRSINRHNWQYSDLMEKLENPKSNQSYILNEVRRIAEIRTQQKAFHPNATQFTLQLCEGLFGFWRQSLNRKQDIFCVTNLTAHPLTLSLSSLNLYDGPRWTDLLTDYCYLDFDEEIILSPYQTVWIASHDGRTAKK